MNSHKILSDIIVFQKYARTLHSDNRRETWDEIVTRNKNMHIKKFPKLKEEIEQNYKYVYDKKVLPSMRSLQFGGLAIEMNNARMFNCSYLPVDDIAAFQEITFLTLSGCGVGYSIRKKHVYCLPRINRSNKSQRYLIADTIEGWADAIKVLMKHHLKGKPKPVFDYSDIRKKGSVLKVSGGVAPGHEKFKESIIKIDSLLSSFPEGYRLSPLDCHDIICHITAAVYSAGIRRSALIALFDSDDYEMARCKSRIFVDVLSTKEINSDNGKLYEIVFKYRNRVDSIIVDSLDYIKDGFHWWQLEPQRSGANNSVVYNREAISYEDFSIAFDILKNSGSGEPGFFLTNDKDGQTGTNPCAEIGLNPFQMCNLVEVNVSNIESQEDFEERVRVATFIATLQASYTNFHYLRSSWKEVTDKEALLGVGMTGIASLDYKKYDFKSLSAIALKENERVANLIGINKAARIGCVKPSGTTSIVLGCSSGIHSWYDNFYIRRVRINKSDPLFEVLNSKLKQFMEDDYFNSDQSILSLPIAAPKGSITRQESPIDLLNRAKFFYENWILNTHRSGIDTHNVSITVFANGEEDWQKIKEWLWENKNYYCGVTVLPYDGGTYKQAPFESISEEQYLSMISNLPDVDINSSNVQVAPSLFTAEASCSSFCEITDI